MKFLTNIAELYTLVTTYPCGLKSQHLKRESVRLRPEHTHLIDKKRNSARNLTLSSPAGSHVTSWELWVRVVITEQGQAAGSTRQGGKYGSHLVKKGGGRQRKESKRPEHRELFSAVKHCQAFSPDSREPLSHCETRFLAL